MRKTIAGTLLCLVAALATAQEPPSYEIPGVAGDATHSSAARDPVDGSDSCSNTGKDRWINTVTDAEWYCYDSTTDNWEQVSPGGTGGGGGDVTGGQNLVDGYDVFKQENPTTHILEFRSLSAGTNVTMAEGTNTVTVNASGEANTCSNQGAGEAQLCGTKSGVNLPIRTLKEGTGITFTTQGDGSVLVDAAGGGDHTASNLGTSGARVFSSEVGSDFQFRRIVAGTGTSVTENVNDISVAGTYTAENASTGDAQIYRDTTSGPVFNFRSLDSISSNLTVANNGNKVDLSTTADDVQVDSTSFAGSVLFTDTTDGSGGTNWSKSGSNLTLDVDPNLADQSIVELQDVGSVDTTGGVAHLPSKANSSPLASSGLVQTDASGFLTTMSATGLTDNEILRTDGVTGALQKSGVNITDTSDLNITVTSNDTGGHVRATKLRLREQAANIATPAANFTDLYVVSDSIGAEEVRYRDDTASIFRILAYEDADGNTPPTSATIPYFNESGTSHVAPSKVQWVDPDLTLTQTTGTQYVQLDAVNSDTIPAADCDAYSEVGRMVVRSGQNITTGKQGLCVCVNDSATLGWKCFETTP